MKYIAKPNLNNTIGQKTFDKIEDALQYLEEKTGHKMDFEVDKNTKEKTYDWELIGKLKRVKA